MPILCAVSMMSCLADSGTITKDPQSTASRRSGMSALLKVSKTGTEPKRRAKVEVGHAVDGGVVHCSLGREWGDGDGEDAICGVVEKH